MVKKHSRPSGRADVALPDITDGVLQGLRQRFYPIGDTEPLFRKYTSVERFGDLPAGAVEAFSKLYLVHSVASKLLDERQKGGAKERYDAALVRFRESEELCRKTNSRFINGYRVGPENLSPSSRMGQIFGAAQREILSLIGESPNLDMASKGFNYGPGATTSLRRPDASPWNKFRITPDSSSSCLIYVEAYLRFNTSRSTYLNSEGMAPYNIRESNKIVTVEKNAVCDRTIGIEPDWNMFFQKGFGFLIRKALRKVGVDLNDQRPNQIAAQLGSLYGNTATIDLKMASDCMAIELVRYLVPPGWYAHLERLRVASGVLASGEIVQYQKFSSMGNGFTFELESLIFWALCRAVCRINRADERLIRVYGDDIICPLEAYTELVSVLAYAGFHTNVDKTFSKGGFRESCGKHYFWGEDVTPFYIRKNVKSLSSYIKLANAVRRHARLSWGLDNAYESTYTYIVDRLPNRWRRPRIPDGYGDAALIGDFDECSPRRLTGGLYFGAYSVKGLVPKTSSFVPDETPSLLWFQHASYIKCEGRELTVNITVEQGYTERKFRVGQWQSYGPWL